MTKEEHRSYWKTLVDEERQIGLPASIFRHYRKIKSPGHRLAIWPFLWPQPPISRGLHSLIFENADGPKGHRIARGNPDGLHRLGDDFCRCGSEVSCVPGSGIDSKTLLKRVRALIN